jgi:hypothetical protein
LATGTTTTGTNAEAGIVKGIKQNVVKSITTSRTLGFRIVGLRSYQVDTQTYTTKSMLYGTPPRRGGRNAHQSVAKLLRIVVAIGTTLRAGTMIEGLSLYLDNGREIRSDVIPTMLKKIGKCHRGNHGSDECTLSCACETHTHLQRAHVASLRMRPCR